MDPETLKWRNQLQMFGTLLVRWVLLGGLEWVGLEPVVRQPGYGVLSVPSPNPSSGLELAGPYSVWEGVQVAKNSPKQRVWARSGAARPPEQACTLQITPAITLRFSLQMPDPAGLQLAAPLAGIGPSCMCWCGALAPHKAHVLVNITASSPCSAFRYPGITGSIAVAAAYFLHIDALGNFHWNMDDAVFGLQCALPILLLDAVLMVPDYSPGTTTKVCGVCGGHCA